MANFTRSEAWKNFDLGQELAISGAFIYNGLRTFYRMQTLVNTDEIFEFLYGLAIGFERLLKVCVVLLEHDTAMDQSSFEASLVTHNHLDLLDRVRKHRAITLGRPHTRLLKLLVTFYKTHRYDRYTLSPRWEPDKEREGLKQLLEANLHVAINDTEPFAIENKQEYRAHIQSVVYKVARSLFDIVHQRASELNLYTYELRHGSKAAVVFMDRTSKLEDDDVLWKELLVFLMNTKETSEALEFLRGIDPLPFDKALVSDYLQCFRSDSSTPSVREELEELYLGLKDPGERLRMLNVIGNPHYLFDIDDDVGPDQ